jgi:hypothetical protein
MARNLKIATTTLLAAIFLLALGLVSANAEEDKKEKPLRIRWESVEGIIKFTVQIKDSSGEIVLDKTVDSNYVDFVLPPGKYQIRIGAINKFEKLSFWTDWDSIEIRKSIKSRFFTNDFAAKVGLKINAGIAYSMLMPNWNSKYNDSLFNLKYMPLFGTIGFHFGNSKYIEAKNVLKYMGIELDGSYCRYDDKHNITFKSSIMQVTGGLNLFFKTQLKIPLNFYLRFGGGVAYSYQKFTKYNISSGIPFAYQYGNVKSLDPYAKVGVSMEINFLFAMSLNLGVDLINVFYRDEIFMGLRYYAMVGVRI